MKHFVQNLLPRLKQYSSTLDKKEIFIDKSWLLVDEEQNLHRYIFKRNGELIMSCNGKVEIGKWEYLANPKMLLIDRLSDKILLGQNFVDPALMILHIDGGKESGFILANEQIIPDLNIGRYLHELYRDKNKVSIVNIKGGIELEVLFYSNGIEKNKVSILGEDVPDSILEHENYKYKYVVSDSYISKVITTTTYNTKLGEIFIEHERSQNPAVGDLVFNHSGIAEDGKYKLSFMEHIEVKNGQIIRKSNF